MCSKGCKVGQTDLWDLLVDKITTLQTRGHNLWLTELQCLLLCLNFLRKLTSAYWNRTALCKMTQRSEQVVASKINLNQCKLYSSFIKTIFLSTISYVRTYSETQRRANISSVEGHTCSETVVLEVFCLVAEIQSSCAHPSLSDCKIKSKKASKLWLFMVKGIYMGHIPV